MTKTIASLIALTAITMSSTAMAGDAPNTKFKTAMQYDVSASVEATYKTLKKQSHKACKQQIVDVRTFSTRFNYMRTCKAQLLDDAVAKVENRTLSQYHAAQTGKVETQQLAALQR